MLRVIDGWCSDGICAPYWVGLDAPQASSAAAEPLARSPENNFSQPVSTPLLIGLEHGRSVFHIVEEGCSRVHGKVLGVREDLRTGERVECERGEEVFLGDAENQVRDEDRKRLGELWELVTDAWRGISGKVWYLVLERLQKGDDLQTAWLEGWFLDACNLRDDCKWCGSKTVERTDSKGTTYRRDRCGNVRCSNCGKRLVGEKWKKRLVAQGRYDREHGDDWIWMTVTLDAKAWCEKHGLPYGDAAALMAQRWIGRAYAELIESMRGVWHDIEDFRVLETHNSQWPHIHALFRGSLQREALEEAIKPTTRGKLIKGLKGTTWEHVARYSQEQTELKEAARAQGLKRTARCPFRDLRQRVRDMAQAHGFGEVFDLRPVDPCTVEDDMPAYMSKGPVQYDGLRNMPDTGAAIAGEMSKSGQRAQRLLARGVRCFEASRRRRGGHKGFLHAAPPDRPEAAEDLVQYRRIDAPITLVREVLAALQHKVDGDVLLADFTGPIPERGQKRPRILEAFVCDGASYVDELREALVLEARELDELARSRGYVPITLEGRPEPGG